MDDQVAQPGGNNPLWAFADALYSSPGVEETCLRLQDQHAANVNLMLWCCWLETRSIELSRSLLDKAQCAIQQWDAEIVQPLRRTRRVVKHNALLNNTARLLKATIQEAELLAELHEQDELFELTLSLGQRNDDPPPGANLRLYLVSLGVHASLDGVLAVFRSGMKNLGGTSTPSR